jgi:hypothetical protein
MNFSPDAWTGVSVGQVYWTPPPHMQPLSSRTIRFMIDVSSVNGNFYRSIVKFGSTDSDFWGDRIPAIYIALGQATLHLSATKLPVSNAIVFDSECSAQLVGPSFITVVWTRTSLSVFINSVKQTNPGCSGTFSQIADTDYSMIARRVPQPNEGFTLRSLQLLDYAMPDLEAQAPVIISVTPHVLLASHVSLTVMGSPFTAGAACSALFLDGSVSATCNAVSAVEIVVTLNARAPTARPSMLAAVLHNGRTFRAPVNCIPPYFVTGLNGLCLESVRYSLSVILLSIQLGGPLPPICSSPCTEISPFVQLFCLLNLNFLNRRPGLCNRMGSRFALSRGGCSQRMHAAVCLCHGIITRRVSSQPC